MAFMPAGGVVGRGLRGIIGVGTVTGSKFSNGGASAVENLRLRFPRDTIDAWKPQDRGSDPDATRESRQQSEVDSI
jgi:hypothetical protein